MLPIFFIHKNPNFFCLIRVKFNSFFLSDKPIIFIMLDNVKPFSWGFFGFLLPEKEIPVMALTKKRVSELVRAFPLGC